MSNRVRIWASALLLATGAGLQIGCQACGSCHDYSPPVADCQCSGCNSCGGGRSGSTLSGYAATEGDALDEAVEVAQQPLLGDDKLRR